MIEQLTGTLLRHSPTVVVLDVNGVGFSLQMTVPGASRFTAIGELCTIPTWLHVKEDGLTLYGFRDETERELFEALIGVSGIGPKTAQRILSETTPEQLVGLILEENTLSLSKIKGIGKKTAEMLVIQLKGPFSKRELSSGEGLSVTDSPIEREALLALMALGVKEATALKAIEKVRSKGAPSPTVQNLISEALHHT